MMVARPWDHGQSREAWHMRYRLSPEPKLWNLRRSAMAL